MERRVVLQHPAAWVSVAGDELSIIKLHVLQSTTCDFTVIKQAM